MAQETTGQAHWHIRKRVHQKKQKYPSPQKGKNFIDKGIYLVGIAAPLMTLPQVIQIWAYKQTAGVSMITWVGYLIGAIFWLAYGIMHKEKPIIAMYISWIIMEILIITGLLIF